MKTFKIWIVLTLTIFTSLVIAQSLRTIKTDSIVPNNPLGTSVDIGTGLTVEGSTVIINDILDEDDLVSDSATALVTQQSIKAFIDALVDQDVRTTAIPTFDHLTLNNSPTLANPASGFTSLYLGDGSDLYTLGVTGVSERVKQHLENDRMNNPSFEISIAASPALGWTYTPSGADVATIETASANVIHGSNSLEITPAAETFTLDQEINVDAFAGSKIGFNVWVKADFDMEVCAFRDSTELSCESYTADSGYKEFITIQDAINGENSGLRIKSDSSVTGTAYIDYAQFKASPLATAQLYASSKYEQYTPTIQGMSGGSSISFFWKRVGDSIIIMGDLTTGAAESLEIQLGLPSGLTIDSAKVTTVMNVGSSEENASGTDNFTILATGGDSFLNVGVRGGSFSAGLTPQTDTTLFGSGRQINFVTQPIPITGWLDTKQGVVVKGVVASDIANENTFSATIDNGAGSACTTGTCTVTNEGLDWIEDVDYAGTTGKYNVNFNLGVFTSIPNCHADPVTVNVGRQCRVENQSTSTVTVECEDNSDAVENNVFTLICDRGDDKVLESEKAIVFPDGITPKTCFVKDVKVNNSAGGTATSGSFQTREFNTTSGRCSFLSLSSNQFTLQAGSYDFDCVAPAHFVNIHKAKIRNITDGADIPDLIGSSERADDASNSVATMSSSTIKGSLEISEAKVFELQHRVSRTQATNGFGNPANFSLNEVYSQCAITKVR